VDYAGVTSQRARLDAAGNAGNAEGSSHDSDTRPITTPPPVWQAKVSENFLPAGVGVVRGRKAPNHANSRPLSERDQINLERENLVAQLLKRVEQLPALNMEESADHMSTAVEKTASATMELAFPFNGDQVPLASRVHGKIESCTKAMQSLQESLDKIMETTHK